MITAVIFDLDGTLIDSTDAIVESFFHTCDTLGLPRPPRDNIVRSIGHTLPDQFRLITDHDPHECVRVYRAYYGQVACAKTTAMPGAAESVRRLREAGLRLGFATSKKRVFAELILDHLGMMDAFDAGIGPDDVTHPKPHPEAILKSLDRLGVAPEQAVVVGDTSFDVLAARAAGVRCLCVTTGYNTRQELLALNPEAVFDSLSELTEYILAHQK